MSTLTDLLTADWVYTLGLTLVHSVWQTLVIFLVVLAGLRLVPVSRSRVRYAIACGGLFLIVISSCITFAYVSNTTPTAVPIAATAIPQTDFASATSVESPGVAKIFSVIPSVITQYMPWIVCAWMAGFLIFAFRLMAGFMYTQRIRSSSFTIENEWSEYLRQTGKKLGISRLVSLAESGTISAPMVVGYIKPVILIPVGMLTGLTTAQLETIFLHELAHIKRYDYLINLIQSVVEIIFFFNPFVWSLSGIIRREREYCCDDLVVGQHGARVYAHALTHLAEKGLSSPAFALSLADDKNQLLNRIRRIMEKSVKNRSGKTRILVPAILLLAGLFCISWLAIPRTDAQSNPLVVDRDTIIEEDEGSARYSRKSIITIDENGQPHEEVIEKFEGDEELRPLLEENMPALPDISSWMAPLPPPVMSPGLPKASDTIPPVPFDQKDLERWEEFSRTFEEAFRKDFKDFFSFRGNDPGKWMEELQERFNSEDWPHFDFPPGTFDLPENFFENDSSFQKLEENLERLRDFNMEHFKNFEKEFELDSVVHTGRYQDALREQLVEDGYLSADEPIESLEWNDKLFKVNGKAVKPEDEEKYRALNRQYFNRRPLDKLK